MASIQVPTQTGRRCEKCDYDLRGHHDARCPECGVAFDPELPYHPLPGFTSTVMVTLCVLLALSVTFIFYVFGLAERHVAHEMFGWCGTGRMQIHYALTMGGHLVVPAYFATRLGLWLCPLSKAPALLIRCCAVASVAAWAGAYFIVAFAAELL